jgi:N-acetylglucosamine repressor
MSYLKTGKPSSMRELNKRIVLDIIKKRKYISKIELSRISGLKPPTISNIFNDLLKENLIIYHGKGENNINGGPKPDLYKVNCESRYFIGIDVNVVGIQAVIIDLEANVVQSTYIKACYESQERLTEGLKFIISNLVNKSKVDIELMEGIGIALQGMVDGNTGIIKASNINVLNNYDIKEILEKEFSIKVYVDNDISTLAIGQSFTASKGSEIKNALCLGVRQDLGLGIVIDNKLYRGSDGMSSNVLCFESAKGNHNIEQDVKKFIFNEKNFDFSRLNSNSAEDIDIKKICYAIQKNDRNVIDIVKKTFFDLGTLGGTLIQLFNPDCFMVCSEFFNYNNELYEYMISVIRNTYKSFPYKEVLFVKLPYEDDTIACCAANHILKEFYSVNEVFN